MRPNVQVSEVVVGRSLSEIYMVMEYVEHDLKQLSESMKQPFSIAEVSPPASIPTSPGCLPWPGAAGDTILMLTCLSEPVPQLCVQQSHILSCALFVEIGSHDTVSIMKAWAQQPWLGNIHGLMLYC